MSGMTACEQRKAPRTPTRQHRVKLSGVISTKGCLKGPPNKYTQPHRENKNAAASPDLPVKTFRLGRIKAAVWETEGDQKFYTVTFARTVMDEANKYHDTDSWLLSSFPRAIPKRGDAP